MKVAIFVSPDKRALTASKRIKELKQFGEHEIFNLQANDKNLKADVIISLGGDGTFLKAASIALEDDIPLLGFNLGNLGFLTEGCFDDCEKIIGDITCGRYTINERMVLECSVEKSNGEILHINSAVNEAVIYRAEETKLPSLSFSIGGIYGGVYRADGMIIASPTGSTAYSLSAGGPIVSPELNCMILTALSPHTLSARPLVVPPDKTISVSEITGKIMSLSLDGHSNYRINTQDRVLVKRRKTGLKTISLKNNFYRIAREKLGWIE